MTTLDCDICFDSYDDEKKVPACYPCGHVFCYECIVGMAKAECPSCQWTPQRDPTFQQILPLRSVDIVTKLYLTLPEPKTTASGGDEEVVLLKKELKRLRQRERELERGLTTARQTSFGSAARVTNLERALEEEKEKTKRMTQRVQAVLPSLTTTRDSIEALSVELQRQASDPMLIGPPSAQQPQAIGFDRYFDRQPQGRPVPVPMQAPPPQLVNIYDPYTIIHRYQHANNARPAALPPPLPARAPVDLRQIPSCFHDMYRDRLAEAQNPAVPPAALAALRQNVPQKRPAPEDMDLGSPNATLSPVAGPSNSRRTPPRPNDRDDTPVSAPHDLPRSPSFGSNSSKKRAL